MNALDKINQPNDIKRLSREEIACLPEEIRSFLLEHVSKTGGHVASNLGAVELTIALHLVMNFPEDRLIWDVGHQSYTHKILTGRKDAFSGLRTHGGISGFPKRQESECDCYDTGHSSTSISAGIGMAQTRQLHGEDNLITVVIGDGAFTGGMAFEALNNASALNSNLIIVLNDNQMSISRNVGGFSRHLSSLRTAKRYQDLKSDVRNRLDATAYGEHVARRIHKAKNSLKELLIPGMIFENMGVTYLGPIDGHNIWEMVRLLNAAKKVDGPVLVHVLTNKGQGYLPAERLPDRFHGIGPFQLETGKPLHRKTRPNYTDVFSEVITNMARKDERIVAVTAAMSDGTGLKKFSGAFPERFFDVGIAEEHAVSFCAGLAVSGMRPVFAVYSSFLQRAIDQMMMDVCLQNLPVIFAIDRAGLVGADGETHQGNFDLSYLSMMPNMTVMAPKNAWELADMLRAAVRMNGPVAIRYPRGASSEVFRENRAPIVRGTCEKLLDGGDVAVFAVGSMVEVAADACSRLREQGLACRLYNARFVKPLDEECLKRTAGEVRLMVTMEENVLQGGFGSSVVTALADEGILTPVLRIGIPDRFVEHGSVDELRRSLELDADSVARRILAAYEKTEKTAAKEIGE